MTQAEKMMPSCHATIKVQQLIGCLSSITQSYNILKLICQEINLHPANSGRTLYNNASYALIKQLVIILFHCMLKLKDCTQSNTAHDGAWPMLCTVYYSLTRVTVCSCLKCDAKTRLHSPSEARVLQTAACVRLPNSPALLHLCRWPGGAARLCTWETNQRTVVCNTVMEEDGLARCRTYTRTTTEVQLHQMAAPWPDPRCNAEPFSACDVYM